MSPRGLRRARALEFATVAGGAAFAALALIFLAARVWFRSLFLAATGADPLIWAGCFGAVAVLLGIHHTFRDPYLSRAEGQAYKTQD